MTNFNNNILIRNIKSLIEEKRLTQEEFGRAIGMSQSNLSKALKNDSCKRFTLEQIYNIAEYFNVSIDTLLGRSKEHLPEYTLSSRGIASEFVRILETGYIKIHTFPIEEEITEPYWDSYQNCLDATKRKETIAYHALYTPSYWYPETDDEYQEIEQCGNTAVGHAINEFLHCFINIRKMYLDGMIKEEYYHTIVEDLLNHLPDRSLPNGRY